MNNIKTKFPPGRLNLALVIQQSGDLIDNEDVSSALNISRHKASKQLSRWSKQGWLRRVSPGVYAPVPFDSIESQFVLDDPWVIVPKIYSPCYVGGRTAAEYWDLTEQVFRDIVVFTAANLRKSNQIQHGTRFTLKRIQINKIFGTKVVWRGKSKVLVSDVHRTIIDILTYPELGGGIQHVADCLINYFGRDDRNDELLIRYATQAGNGAVFKRLGFLAERYSGDSDLAATCFSLLTKGTAKLDPNLICPRMVTRWRLRIPQSWSS